MTLFVAQSYLCSDLYDASGWGDTFTGYYRLSPDRMWQWEEHLDRGAPSELVLPAYDLGYLMDKLSHINYDGRTVNLDYIVVDDEKALITDAWIARLWNTNRFEQNVKYAVSALTPADAAAKLAIELFTGGLLGR